jgi:head-tail adaptor
MPRFNPGQFRHQVDVYLPSTALDARGRRTGDPTLVLAGLPCSIEQLSALELIRAQKIWAEATHRVRCYQDPSNPLTERNYLLWGTVVLNIGAVVDADNTGIEVECLCKEERQIAGLGGGTPIAGQRPALLYLQANGQVSGIKVNLTATAAPTVNDDAGDGYAVGSFWWDTAHDQVYLCLDATAGAAVWQEWQGPAGADRTAQVRSDYVSPYSYLGVAPVGSAESAEVWRITRIEQHSDGTVTTATAENVAWDDRLTATYT